MTGGCLVIKGIGYTSMLRHLTGDTDQVRQKMREEVLETTVDDFRAFSQILHLASENGIIKVMGSTTAIEQANSQSLGQLQIVKVL